MYSLVFSFPFCTVPDFSWLVSVLCSHPRGVLFIFRRSVNKADELRGAWGPCDCADEGCLRMVVGHCKETLPFLFMVWTFIDWQFLSALQLSGYSSRSKALWLHELLSSEVIGTICTFSLSRTLSLKSRADCCTYQKIVICRITPWRLPLLWEGRTLWQADIFKTYWIRMNRVFIWIQGKCCWGDPRQLCLSFQQLQLWVGTSTADTDSFSICF